MRKYRYWTLHRGAFKHIALSAQEIAEISDLYQNFGREKILFNATKKKIVPAIAALMVKLEIDKSFWESITIKYRERNFQVVKCLDFVYSALSSAGINRIGVVENFGALLSSEEDLAMFGSGDVDNYADSDQRLLIYEVLSDLGFTITETKAGNLLISSAISKEGFFPENFYFGINWDVTCRINLPCLTSKGEFVDWNNMMQYKDTAIRMPPREALMYICMMHIAVHGFSRAPDIRLYYDVANAESTELDWNKIREWAVRDGNSTRIAIVGYLTKQLLGVPVPDFILLMGNESQKRKLISLVYDMKHNALKNSPNRLTVLGIDIFSSNDGAFLGLRDIVFPDKEWLFQKYGRSYCAKIKHILSLI